MFPGRFTTGQPSAVRKTRVDVGKPSMLPKPRRPGSIDRASTDARRPSGGAGAGRSSSAEPARATLAGAAAGRLSREASASKIPLNRRSRTQQAEPRYMQTLTPLHGNRYSRTTTTPVRTPSEDRQSRSWQASVERTLAFLTVKDQRPITNLAWQRTEVSRVQEALAARGLAGGAGDGKALVRPLTITRFVELTGGLLAAIMGDVKLNNDNYVTKLPHLAKRLLYPGVLSKSWLKTVNTLHAFPHALACIAYFLDLVTHIETPVSDEWLYTEKDEISQLRRAYLHKCWIRFQEPVYGFEELNEEYLQELKQLLGDDQLRVAQLQEIIGKCEADLEDEAELAARAEEERVRARRDALAGSLRGVRGERRAARAAADTQRARRADRAAALRACDNEIAVTITEIEELKEELETQSISVAERAQLLDKVDYATRVADSKRTLADQVSKMVQSKETELAGWQKRTLDSCVEYKQRLIHLAAHFPHLAALAVDEKELMEAECAAAVSRAVDTLRAHAHQLADQRAEHARARTALSRQRTLQLEETRAKIADLKTTIEREQHALDSEVSRETSDAAAWAADRQRLAARLEALRARLEEYGRAQAELEFWEEQDLAWRTKLSEMHEFIDSLREDTKRKLEAEKRKRTDVIKEVVSGWHARLDHTERMEREMEDRRRDERDGEDAASEHAI